MISINIIHGKPFVWSNEDVLILRRSHRITGKLVGCLPRSPYQDTFLGLPLQLMPEEATLLVEKDLARMVEWPRLQKEASADEKKTFLEMRQQSYNEQIEYGKEQRRRTILDKADVIVKGKRRKIRNSPQPDKSEEISDDAIIQEEIDKIQPLPPSSAVVQIFTECPWLNGGSVQPDWKFPADENEKLRYEVFKHFWEKGYYITSGQKFGGDFLVYPGDPHQSHSTFIVVCIPYHEKISMLEIIAKGRLSTSVKKTTVLCSLVDGQVSHLSIQWTSIK